MKWVKVWDPDHTFYHYEITANGGNDMNKELEKLIEQWEQQERELRNKIREEKDEYKREYLIREHTIAIKILRRLRERQWREL